MGEEYYEIWVVNGNALEGWYILCDQWNAMHFSLFVKNNCLIQFEYTVFCILINPFTATPGIERYRLSTFCPEEPCRQTAIS